MPPAVFTFLLLAARIDNFDDFRILSESLQSNRLSAGGAFRTPVALLKNAKFVGPGSSNDSPGYAAAPLTAANHSPTLMGRENDTSVCVRRLP